MTIKEAAQVLDRPQHVIRQFASRNAVAARSPKLGEGRERHYFVDDLASKLRMRGYIDEADRLEQWHRAHGGNASDAD